VPDGIIVYSNGKEKSIEQIKVDGLPVGFGYGAECIEFMLC